MPVLVMMTVFSMSWMFLTWPTSRTLICCSPAWMKLPPPLALLLASCCSTCPMLSP